MADELEERLLAQYGSNAVRGSDGRRYEVEPYRDPLASSNFRQFEWAKNNPQVAQPLAELLKYLSFMPMGRSTGGERIGYNNAMAGRLEKIGSPYDTAITGGSTAPRAGASWDNPAVAQSSAGLAYEPGMRYAGGERSRYASPGYEMRWTEPANINTPDPFLGALQGKRPATDVDAIISGRPQPPERYPADELPTRAQQLYKRAADHQASVREYSQRDAAYLQRMIAGWRRQLEHARARNYSSNQQEALALEIKAAETALRNKGGGFQLLPGDKP